MSNFELKELETNVIVQAFATQGGSLLLVDRIAEEVRKHVPDVTTKKGRDAIGSLAAKVSKSKTIAEKYAKDLVAEEKARIKLVDDDRIQFVKRMDALRDEILAPRNVWEQAEKDRVAKHEGFISEIKNLSIQENSNSQMIRDDIEFLTNEVVVDSSLEEYEEQAKLAKFETLEILRKALVEREKYEAEQAELERLRQAEQARLQRERDERIAREAAEQATREAEAKAQAEAERVQREKLESEQREARLQAEKEAAELREQALKQKAIEAEKQAEIEKQRAIEAEAARIKAEAEAQAKAEAEKQAKREANLSHRKRVSTEALKGLTDLGIDIQIAKAVLKAINEQKVPHVSINF